MGCGASKSGADDSETGKTPKKDDQSSKAAKDKRKQSIFVKIPEIKVTSGDAVKLIDELPRVIFIFGMEKTCKNNHDSRFLPGTQLFTLKFAMGLQTQCMCKQLAITIFSASCMLCIGSHIKSLY